MGGCQGFRTLKRHVTAPVTTLPRVSKCYRDCSKSFTFILFILLHPVCYLIIVGEENPGSSCISYHSVQKSCGANIVLFLVKEPLSIWHRWPHATCLRDQNAAKFQYLSKQHVSANLSFSPSPISGVTQSQSVQAQKQSSYSLSAPWIFRRSQPSTKSFGI